MATHKSIKAALSEATKKLKKNISDVLINEVSQVVTETESQHVVTDVYSRPESNLYERRYYQGGLADYQNIHSSLQGNKNITLVVSNDTPFNPYKNGRDSSDGISDNAGRAEGLDGLVNYGNGWNEITYDWANCDETLFVEKTISDLKANKEHVEAMKIGLKTRGYDVD